VEKDSTTEFLMTLKPVFQRTFKELQELIGEEFDVDPQKITPETRFVALGVDSLDLRNFLVEFETWAGVDAEDVTILRVQDLMNIAGIP